MGISCEPRRASISALETLVNATGVVSSAREANTSNAESSSADTLNAKLTVVFPVIFTD